MSEASQATTTQIAAAPAAAPSTAPAAKGTGIGVGKSDGQSSQEQVAKQIRELGDSDLDAVVKLKIDGKEVKATLRDAIKYAQMGQAADKRLAEAKEARSKALEEQRQYQLERQQMQNMHRQALQNPEVFRQIYGVDPYEYAEATLTQKLKMMQMSPEARRAMELESELQRERADKQKLLDEKEQGRLSAQEKEYQVQVDKELSEAFTKSGLPKKPYYLARIANEMLTAATRGEELSAEEAAAIVKEKYRNQELPEVVRTMPLEEFLEVAGPDRLKELREHFVKQVQNQDPPSPQKRQSTPAKPKKQKAIHSDSEYRAWVESLKTGTPA